MSHERDALHTINCKHGLTAYVVNDPDPQSPEDWDRVGEITCRALSAYRGNNPFGKGGNNVTEEGLAELAAELKAGARIGLAVDVRDHGANGIRLWTHADFDDCDAIISCTLAKAIEEWGSDSDKLAGLLAEALTETCKARALAYLKGEIDSWQEYFSGEVYGVVVKDAHGKELDSCWGYYGLDYAKSEAESSGKALAKGEGRKIRAKRAAAKREKAERSFWACRGMVTA